MYNGELTFLCTVYNEEKRIDHVLRHATKWADHIIIIDKSSTDGTRDIAASYPGVTVNRIPYRPAGVDDAAYYLSLSPTDWVFMGTASEIPTKKLIDKVRSLIREAGDTLDLINVPRKMYSLGINHPDSPWYVSYYPFCIHRTTAIIHNTIHNNYFARDPSRVTTIPYSEDCCVYHLTHVTAKSYLDTMTQYFEAEADAAINPEKSLEECFRSISDWEERIRHGGSEVFGSYCAWPIYQLGKALFIWEKYRDIDVSSYYDRLKEYILATEWDGRIDCEKPIPEVKWGYQRSLPLGIKPVEGRIQRCLTKIKNILTVKNWRVYLNRVRMARQFPK